MNNKKRNELKSARDFLDKGLNIVYRVKYEEEDSLSNMPENLENSDRYRNIESAIDSLDEAIYKIEEAQNDIDEAML